jgi:hypothetical protein
VIAMMKKLFRGSLLQKPIYEGNDLGVLLKKVTALDAIYEESKAWNKLTGKSWRKVCPDIKEEDCLTLKKKSNFWQLS